MAVQVERLTTAICYHGEGPFWDDPRRRLLFFDVLKGEILTLTPDGATSRHPVPSAVATTIRRRGAEGLVVATERGVVGVDDDFQQFTPIANLPLNSGCRTNDGGCDPLGGFVIGTMAYDGRRGAGGVYRIAPGHNVTQLVDSVTISNGVQWSADSRRVFYVDSPSRRIDTFEFNQETGAWTARRVHIDLAGSTPGLPDGMAIDVEDGLWVALWEGGAVNHYDAAGRLVETIEIPGVSRVSSCAFGGDDRRILFVTTSRQGLPEGDEENAGAVFAFETDTRGAALWDFHG